MRLFRFATAPSALLRRPSTAAAALRNFSLLLMSFIDDNTAEYMLYCSTSIVDAAMLLSATPSAVRGAQLLKASMCVAPGLEASGYYAAAERFAEVVEQGYCYDDQGAYVGRVSEQAGFAQHVVRKIGRARLVEGEVLNDVFVRHICLS